MAKLIDADDYCKANGCSPPYGDVLECANCCICDCPTIEAEPVRHGYWIAQDEGRTRYMCSECKSKNHGGYEKYCPNCGAKMDGKENEHEF